MEKDKHKTDIVFRCDKHGDFKGIVFALFPHEVSDHKGNVMSYQHVGQHSGANYNGCVADSRLATAEEYKGLKEEMESIGYNINIVKKRNYDKYLKSYKEVTEKN